MRALLWSVVTVLVLLLAGGATGVYLFATDTGSAWLLQQASTRLPAGLELDGPAGNLANGLKLQRLRYVDDTVDLTAEAVEIRIRWPALAAGQLRIRDLTAQRVRINLPSSDEPPAAIDLDPINAPLPIVIRRASIGTVEVSGDDFSESISNIELSGAWRGSQLRIKRLGLEAREVQIRAKATASLAGRLPLDITVDWQHGPSGFIGGGTAQGDLAAIKFSHRLTAPYAVESEGWLRAVDNDPQLAATTRWQQLSVTTAGRTIVSDNGALELAGWIDAYTVHLSGEAQTEALPPLSADLVASGTLDELKITSMTIRGLDGEIRGKGNVLFAGPRLELELSGENLNPEFFDPRIAGELSFSGELLVDGPERTQFRIGQLAGTVAGRPIGAEGVLEFAAGELRAEAMNIRSGTNQIAISGRLTPTPDVDFRIDAPSLDLLDARLAGAVTGQGRIAGSLESPQANAKLSIRNGQFDSLSTAALELSASLASNSAINISLQADELSNNDLALGRLELSVDGTLAAHTAVISLSDGLVGAEMESNGSWKEAQLTQEIVKGRVSAGEAQAWSLREPLRLELSGDKLQFSAQCWEGDAGALLCLDSGTVSAASQSLSGRLQAFPLSQFNMGLPPSLAMAGSADADFTFRRSADTLNLKLRWEQKETTVTFRGDAGVPVESRFERVRLDIDGSPEVVNVSGDISGDYGLQIEIDGSLAQPLLADGDVSFSASGEIPNLAAAAPLLNTWLAVDRVAGKLSAEFAVEGTRQSPKVSGQLALDDASAEFAPTGIRLREMSARITGGDQGPAQFTARANSGDGQLRIDGEVNWRNAENISADVRIDGEMFRIIRFPNQSIDVSPALRAHIEERRIELTGDLGVPRADIVVEELPETAVMPSSDTVVHGETQAEAKPAVPLELTGKINVSVGDAVRFQGFGLTTMLEGDLRLTRRSGKPEPTARGNLKLVEGRFEAYGKELQIERGQLIFDGPLDRPSLDVRAVRTVNYEGKEIKVGVLLTGPSTDIQSRMYSNPPMSDADALSYMVIDRPISRAGSGEGSLLSGAALSLGLRQALPITEEIGDRLGLDEVTFDGAGGEDTSLVAGKRLGDDLYVRYAFGLFNRIGTFIVQYRIGRGLSIEAGSGEEQTLELIYSIDR